MVETALQIIGQQGTWSTGRKKCHQFENDLGATGPRQLTNRRPNKINMSRTVKPYSWRCPSRPREVLKCLAVHRLFRLVVLRLS